MGKANYLIMMAAIILGAALSCSKEINAPEEGNTPGKEEVNPQDQDNLVTWTFTAGVEKPVTKVGPMDDSGNFEWEDNDEIKVLYDGGWTTCNASVTSGVATFSPSVPEGKTTIWLVYPSSMTASLDGGNLIVGMPEAQKNALAGYFVAQAGKDDTTVEFVHPVCYHKFVVDDDGTDVTRLTLTSAAKDITATYVSVDFSGSEPAVSANAGEASSITYDFAGAGTYYIPFVPGATAAGDLTFQFYRGDAKTEKAGGIKYGKALDNARASIVNWASLPAMATNRYVKATGGSSSNNGATWDKAWDFAKFCSVWTSNSNDALLDGINIRFADGTYNFDSHKSRNDSEVFHLIGQSKENTIFEGGAFNHFYANGKTFSLKNIKFTGAARTADAESYGGVLALNACTVQIDNCIFNGNSFTGTYAYGGALGLYGGCNVSVKDTEFLNNSCSGGSTKGGGAVYTQNGTTASFENCKFIGNHTATSQSYNAEMGGAVCVTSTGVVSFNKCLFKDNYATQGGAITVGSSDNENTQVYMNDCVFTGNYIAYRYGTTMLSQQNAQIYINNCTVADDSYSTSGAGVQCSWFNLKCAKFVLCNSSLIGVPKSGTVGSLTDQSAGFLVRFDGVAGTHYFINSIVATDTKTNNSGTAVYLNNASTTLHEWCSRISNQTINENKGTVTVHTGNDRNFVRSQINGLSWDHPDIDPSWNNCYWAWNGTDTGTGIQQKTSDIKKWLTSNTNGQADSSDFYNWLNDDIKAWGQDCRGINRGDTTWPGAYDGTNNN